MAILAPIVYSLYLISAAVNVHCEANSTMAENLCCKKTVNRYDTEDEVAVALAKYTADLSTKFIKEKGYFNVVLSGGNMIDSMRKLIAPPYIHSVDWSKWVVFWVDERVVPLNNPDSNYKLAYDGFLSKVPIPPDNIYHIKYNPSAEATAEEYEQRLKSLVVSELYPLPLSNGFPKFDLILLGMGPDGHVASLFPIRPQRCEKKKWVTFITDSPKPPPPRISFTFPVINSASEIAMVVTSSDLGQIAVSVALKNPRPNPIIKLPVEMVCPQGNLTWFLDKDAASMI